MFQPSAFKAFVTRPSVPNPARNMNASGTPPVLARTDAVAATARRDRVPVLTIALAISAPATAPIAAEIIERRMET